MHTRTRTRTRTSLTNLRCSVLRAVAAAQLFDHFKQADAEDAAQRLVALMFGRDGKEVLGEEAGAESSSVSTSGAASEVITTLGRVLPTNRPTLQLVVMATVVRDVNIEEGERAMAWEGAGVQAAGLAGLDNNESDAEEEEEEQEKEALPNGNDEGNPLVSAGDGIWHLGPTPSN